MKILKNADYDYKEYNINEAAGYTKWYNWTIVRRHTQLLNLVITILVTVFAFICREYLVQDGIVPLFTVLVAALMFFFFIITPLHEILHLLPLAKCKLDDRCVISIGKGVVSAIFNGETTRNQTLVSLLLPFVTFTTVLVPLCLIAEGTFELFMLFLAVTACLGCYADIYMFFYCLRCIGRSSVIFGLFQK